MIRSFLAIELPQEILKRIGEVQQELKTSRADVRWVSPEKIHLTLKFFGNIDESQIDPIVQAIEGPVQGTQPFSLEAKGVGAFPQLKNPRVIWMGLVEGREILLSLQKEVERELVKIGFEPENRLFQPHLTLGRPNSSRGRDKLIELMEKQREEEFGVFKVERVVLFESDLRPTGPIYTALRTLNLGIEQSA